MRRCSKHSSNAHNRAGEAEKSHQKVSTLARDLWTVISLKRVDVGALRTESPTTWWTWQFPLQMGCGVGRS